jgi:hypothetical protein
MRKEASTPETWTMTHKKATRLAQLELLLLPLLNY